jgi:hypothetical protein
LRLLLRLGLLLRHLLLLLWGLWLALRLRLLLEVL